MYLSSFSELRMGRPWNSYHKQQTDYSSVALNSIIFVSTFKTSHETFELACYDKALICSVIAFGLKIKKYCEEVRKDVEIS